MAEMSELMVTTKKQWDLLLELLEATCFEGLDTTKEVTEMIATELRDDLLERAIEQEQILDLEKALKHARSRVIGKEKEQEYDSAAKGLQTALQDLSALGDNLLRRSGSSNEDRAQLRQKRKMLSDVEDKLEEVERLKKKLCLTVFGTKEAKLEVTETGATTTTSTAKDSTIEELLTLAGTSASASSAKFLSGRAANTKPGRRPAKPLAKRTANDSAND